MSFRKSSEDFLFPKGQVNSEIYTKETMLLRILIFSDSQYKPALCMNSTVEFSFLTSGIFNTITRNSIIELEKECFLDYRPFDRVPKSRADGDMAANAGQMIFRDFVMKSD